MNNNKDMLDKLDVMAREIKEMKERLQKPVAGDKEWVPGIGERYWLAYDGEVLDPEWNNCAAEKSWLATGRIFPYTPEGQAAAERFIFLEGFRARWKQSADVAPGKMGYTPALDDDGGFIICRITWNHGLPKWSTEAACSVFVESEGGPEKFKEILEGGIL